MVDWPLTPFIPASLVPDPFRPVIKVPERRWTPLKEHGNRRADGGTGEPENHQLGICGEFALARYLGIENRVDTEVYDDGDGGVDLRFGGHTIDVKTAGRTRQTPALLVSAYKQLRAKYYVLAHRIGARQIRLIGYCPRQFVANAKTREYNGEKVHVVPQDDLFPFPFWLSCSPVGRDRFL